MTGMALGAAGAGAAHKYGQSVIDATRSSSALKTAKSQREMNAVGREFGTDSHQYNSVKDAHSSQVNKHNNNMKRAFKADNMHNKAFGGGFKGKALAYGGSVLAGGILGGVADALND
ncbi:hypothetical protein ACWA2C_16025 [Priestia megaterium]